MVDCKEHRHPGQFSGRCLSLITAQANALRQRQVDMAPIDLGTGETVELRPFPSARLILSARRDGAGWSVSSNGRWKAVEPGRPFRLPLTAPHDDTRYRAPTSANGLKAKMSRYAAYNDLHRRLPIYFLETARRKVASRRAAVVDKNLARQSGLTFVGREAGDRLHLDCLDHGGLFDMSLNTEGDAFPSQVPVGYYSTEFATYVFAWLAQRTGDEKWRRAARLGLAFSMRNLIPYTAVSFDHIEFKLLPLLMLLKDFDPATFSDAAVPDLLAALDYRETDYQPINVLCMRLANLALTERFTPDPTRHKKARRLLRKVARNQTAQGQIQDNFKPASIHNHDLTYHQFSIACLALAIAATPENWDDGIRTAMERVFSEGLAFSRAMARPDGHPSYLGRGCNNIYHIASYIYASTFRGHRGGLSATLALLEAYADETRGWPAALNSERERRMGWNHCAVPYIGQTLFFLTLAHDADEARSSGLVEPGRAALKPGAFACLQDECFHAVAFSGGDSYSWAGGQRATGMAGLASLSFMGIPLLGALEYDGTAEAWLTDLPSPPDSRNGVFRHRIKLATNALRLYGGGRETRYSLDQGHFVIQGRFKKPAQNRPVRLLTFREDTAHVALAGELCAEISLHDGNWLHLSVSAGDGAQVSLSPSLGNSFGPVRSLMLNDPDLAPEQQWTLVLRPISGRSACDRH